MSLARVTKVIAAAVFAAIPWLEPAAAQVSVSIAAPTSTIKATLASEYVSDTKAAFTLDSDSEFQMVWSREGGFLSTFLLSAPENCGSARITTTYLFVPQGDSTQVTESRSAVGKSGFSCQNVSRIPDKNKKDLAQMLSFLNKVKSIAESRVKKPDVVAPQDGGRTETPGNPSTSKVAPGTPDNVVAPATGTEPKAQQPAPQPEMQFMSGQTESVAEAARKNKAQKKSTAKSPPPPSQ